MNKTKFPRPIRWTVYIPEGTHHPNDVVDWFKRCMEDRPAIQPSYKSRWTRGMTGDFMMNSHPIYPTHENWVKWFKKWFSQFIEKGEKNESG